MKTKTMACKVEKTLRTNMNEKGKRNMKLTVRNYKRAIFTPLHSLRHHFGSTVWIKRGEVIPE